MAGFFFPLVVITACAAWAEALQQRAPAGRWVPWVGGGVWLVAMGLGAIGSVTGGELTDRLRWMNSAGVGALVAAGGTVVAMLAVTVMAFVRPAPPDAAPPTP